MNINEEAAFHPYQFRHLGEDDLTQMQDFLNFFDEFFLLCEGRGGSAKALLRSCPPDKDPFLDKILMGIYDKNILIGIIDIIKNYPKNAIWTIGYLLIHPLYRNKKIGSYGVKFLSDIEGVEKLRCIVQRQNSQALHFWKKNGFMIVSTTNQEVGAKESEVFILEREC